MKQTVIASALALALVPSPAFAKDHGHEKHDKKEAKHHDGDHDRDHREKKDHDRDDHDRKNYREHERRVSHDSRRPPGWDKGKKTGWGDCDVPPGQAKKVGCHPDHDRGVTRTHHHERERHERDRRPVMAAQNPRSPRPYPRSTTTTTTTTTRTTTQNKGAHPFEPVLREKQTAGGKDSRSIRQDVR
jgi:hypothetical protein